jgi:methyl-accepting chemotaxis protein
LSTVIAKIVPQASNTILLWLAGVLFAAMAMVQFILIRVLDKLIFKPLEDIMLTTKQIASGDLSEQVETDMQGQLGDLAQNINTMLAGFQGMLMSVTQTGERSANVSNELNDSSQRTASALEEVSASIQTLLGTVEEVEDNSQVMAENTEEVNVLAQDGLGQMKNTQTKMNQILNTSEDSIEIIYELKKASEEIDDIIKVISDIAEQTNLLALNASIEAARASSATEGSGTRRGEAGQGFAVVADEIRDLSEKTQSSIENIRSIIEKLTSQTDNAVATIQENNNQIDLGVQEANKTEEFFEKIVVRIEEVNNQVQQVAEHSQELLAGSQEISTATEEQSAAMDEITNSSGKLNNMAEELNILVKQFQI